MSKLQEQGFLTQIQRGVYQVSANIMLRGSDHKQQLLLSYYNDEQDKNSQDPKPEKETYQDAKSEPSLFTDEQLNRAV